MKSFVRRFVGAYAVAAGLLFGAVFPALAATVRVRTDSPSENPPYDTWDNAAHTLMTAVAFANTNAGTDTILATDGTYTVTSRLNVTNALAIRSVNGPQVTVAQGSGVGTVFFLNNTVAQLSGFRVSGGNGGSGEVSLGGGGVVCMFGSVVISNCIVSGNYATHYGGGVWGGTVMNCVISNNLAARQGGGLHSALARNCLITCNTGGGEGGGGGMYGGIADNCTIVSNTAWRADTGLQNGGGTHSAVVTNSIVYFNSATPGNENWYVGSYAYSCSTPLPAGTGNVSQDPAFVDRTNGNFHLAPGPCIDSGTNETWMAGAVDLDGTNRIINSRVDMGCYEADFANGPLVCNFTGTPLLGFDQVQAVFSSFVNGSNTTISTYVWDFGDGHTLAGPLSAVVTNVYTNVGAYTVTLRVTNSINEGATRAFTDYITVVPRVVYVSPAGSNTYPYDTWSKAANSIQTAVTAAQVIGTNRSTVLVTNGDYTVSSAIVSTKGIEIRSVNGPAVTTVKRVAGSRVFDLQDPAATLAGFTIRDGYVTDGSYNNAGGGVYCWFASAVVSNCNVVNNFATHYGGGVWGGTVVNCVITNNTGTRSGGGLYGSLARNCLIAFNKGAEPPPGGGGGMVGGIADNCTIVSNTAWRYDGFGNGGGVLNTVVTNCIVYFNKGTNTTVDNWSGGSLDYTCTTPLPGSGTNNITDDPRFAFPTTNDYRLAEGSPCIDVGLNLPWQLGATDLGGQPRRKLGVVDLGTYEWSPKPGSVFVVR